MKSEISNLRWEKGSLDLKKNTVRGECSTSAFYNVLLKKCLGFVSLLRLIIRWLCKHLIFASTKKTGKDRADISWDARNDALSYEQLCYHANQDFLKTWSPMWVPWLPLSFQLFNKLPNNALLRFPPFWSSVSGFTAHSHFSSASSHIQSPLSNHRFWQQGRDWSTIYVPLQSSQILHSKNEKRVTQILLMNVQRKLAALQSCLAQCDQSSMY